MNGRQVKTIVKKYFTPVYMVVVLIFICWFFYKTRESVYIYLQNFKAGYLIISAVGLVLFYFFQCRAFMAIQSRNALLPIKVIKPINWYYAYMYGLMGHYIPGKISVIMGRIMVLGPLGIAKEAAVLCILYETIISVTISFAIGFPLIFIADIAGLGQLYLQIGLAVLFFCLVLVFIFTPLFQKSAFLALRLFKFATPPANIFLNRATLLKAVVYYGLSYLFMMLAFYGFCLSITQLGFDLRTIYIVGASMVFSGAVGLLALFAPSGLGVREAGIVYFTAVATNLIPLEIALLISVCFRFLTAAVEIILFAVATTLKKYIQNKSYM